MQPPTEVPPSRSTTPHRSGRTAADARRSRAADHTFFLSAAVLALLLVALGFGRSLAGPALRPRTPLVLMHAAVFAAWIVLFALQTTLVARGRTALHRRLGWVGGALAFGLLTLGSATAIQAARTGYAPVPGVDALAFLIVPMGDLVVFAPLLGAALFWRNTPARHTRLMWLATVSVLTPAISRLPLLQGRPVGVIGGTVGLLLLAPLWELVTRRRIHPVALWGSLGVLVTVAARMPLGQTAAWRAFAEWLVR